MIEERIRDFLAKKPSPSADDSPLLAVTKKMTRQELSQQMISGSKQSSKLMYTEFRKIILDSTLQDHENMLGRFTDLFKSVDRD